MKSEELASAIPATLRHTLCFFYCLTLIINYSLMKTSGCVRSK